MLLLSMFEILGEYHRVSMIAVQFFVRDHRFSPSSKIRSSAFLFVFIKYLLEVIELSIDSLV